LKTPKRIELSIRKAHAFGPTYHVPHTTEVKRRVKKKVTRWVTTAQVEKMRELDGYMTRVQVAKACAVSKSTVTRYLGRLCSQR
jgi:Fic family protein